MRWAASAGAASTVSPVCDAAEASVRVRKRSNAVAPTGGFNTRARGRYGRTVGGEAATAGHRPRSIRQHFGRLCGERSAQRGTAQAGDRTLDRQHCRTGDAQHFATASVEPTHDAEWVDELDVDEAERLLTFAAVRRETLERCPCRGRPNSRRTTRRYCGRRRVPAPRRPSALSMAIGRVDTNRRGGSACQRIAQAPGRRPLLPTVTAMTELRVASPWRKAISMAASSAAETPVDARPPIHLMHTAIISCSGR